MMSHMGRSDEFAEFETTEEDFDCVMARGEAVDVIVPEEPSRGFNELLVLPGGPIPAGTRPSGILVSNLR